MSHIDPLFDVHTLNEAGKAKAVKIAEAYTRLLRDLEVLCLDLNPLSPLPPVNAREFAVVKTKLQEGAFFAKRAMAMLRENQGAVLHAAPGESIPPERIALALEQLAEGVEETLKVGMPIARSVVEELAKRGPDMVTAFVRAVR